MTINGTPAQSKWWLGSVAFPIVVTVCGVVVGLSRPHQDSDWIGVGFMIPFCVAVLLGCTGSICFAVISVRKKEKMRPLAGICGIIAGCVLLFAGFEFYFAATR